MERSIKILLISSWIFILAVCACQSKKETEDINILFSATRKAGTFLETLHYYNDSLITSIDSIKANDRFGVWFSPKRDSVHLNCSLVGIQYLFGDTLKIPIDSIVGFVGRVSRYPDDSLMSIISDTSFFTFKFLPRPKGQVTTIYLSQIDKSFTVDDSTDFLIGWMTDDSSSFPTGLRDSIANLTPVRSYRWQPTDTLRESLDFDLCVRAIFEYEKPLPDSGNFTFELRWNKKKTDLDLCMILPIAQDTICWYKKISKFGMENGHLDVDDNDGYGPEKIVSPYKPAFKDDSARVWVNYYGPTKPKDSTRASVLIYRNSTIPVATVSRSLKPSKWWHVANINVINGHFLLVDKIDSLSYPKLVPRSKR